MDSLTPGSDGRRAATPSPHVSAALRRALVRLFLDTEALHPTLSCRVTTLSSITPEPLLRALAQKAWVTFEPAPRLRRFFGVAGWTCSLTSAGRAALRGALRKEAR